MPGLDGLRALAVLAVLAFHLEVGWAPGGLLGVGIFFTLSGYLITDILLEGWARGGIALGRFWLQRARRLLPALFVVLIVVTAWVTLLKPSELEPLRGAVAAAAGYVSNWWLILSDVPYLDRFGPPSPLGHLWSLAIEEQFYLVWPFVLLLGLRLLREPGRRRARVRPRLAAATLLLAAASAVLMAVLYEPGFDATRVYDGTDTRAFGLLIGAALAMVWPARRLGAAIAPSARRILDGAGLVSLAVIAVLIWRTGYYSAFLYPYGLVLLSVASAVAVACLAHPATRLGRAFGWQPLRWIGVRSYGIYLWHFPIVALTTPVPDPGFDLGRAALQTLATFAAAALSWRYVEDPIRRGALARLWRRLRDSDRPRVAIPRLGWAYAAAGVAAVAIAAVGLAGGGPAPVTGLVASITASSDGDQAKASTVDRGFVRAQPRHHPPVEHAKPPPPKHHPAKQRAKPARSSCNSVVHVGDSTSEGLISHDYLPDSRDRIDSQYARVGATSSRMEIEGATSIVEPPPDGTSAYDAASAIANDGYDGCWVMALGTNDTADVAVGSSVDQHARIDRMMSVVGDRPVLWLTVKSLLGGGPYAEDNMAIWNVALYDACEKYPNLRIYDWAADVQDDWFIEDGIHFTSEGYAARAHRIAKGLAEAFPAHGPKTSPTCVVN